MRVCACAPLHAVKDVACPCSACHLPRLLVFSDEGRHLTCWPPWEENLHVAARWLGIARGWFHAGGGRGFNRKRKPHYDIPKKRLEEIQAKTVRVTERETVLITRGELPERLQEMWRRNIRARADAVDLK